MSKTYNTYKSSSDSDELYTPVFNPTTSNEINKRQLQEDKVPKKTNSESKEKKKKKRVIFTNLTLDDVIYRVKHSKHRPNYYFWGPTGSGKTYCAYKIAASLNKSHDNQHEDRRKTNHEMDEKIDIIMKGQQQIYKKALSQYWRNYHGEKVILMDDVTTESTKFFQQFLKTWGNWYPFEAITDLGNSDGLERRNVTKMTIDPNKYTFIITSSKPPEEVFTFDSEEFERFNRLFYTIHLNSYFTGLFGDESYMSSDEDTDSAASEKKTVTIQSKQVNNDTKKGMSLLHDNFEDIYPTMDVIDEIPTIGEVVDHHGYDATDPFINDNSLSEDSQPIQKKKTSTRVNTMFKNNKKDDIHLDKTYGLENIPMGLKSGVRSQSNSNNTDNSNDNNSNDNKTKCNTIHNTNTIIQAKDSKPIIINDSESQTESTDMDILHFDPKKMSEEETLESSETSEFETTEYTPITTEYDSKIKAKKMNPELQKKELRKYSEPKEYLGKGVYYDSNVEKQRNEKQRDKKQCDKNKEESKPKKSDSDDEFTIHRIKDPDLIRALQRIKEIQKEIEEKKRKEPNRRKTRELGPEDRIHDEEMKWFEQYTIQAQNKIKEQENDDINKESEISSIHNNSIESEEGERSEIV